MIALKFALVVATVLLCWQPSSAQESISKGKRVCPNGPRAPIRVCPRNEEFQCCGACEQFTCDKQVGTVRCFMCPSDCYCKEGYIRERTLQNGGRARCIPIGKCPIQIAEVSSK